MVYKLDEFRESDSYSASLLAPFKESKKNLHEMSDEEIGNILAVKGMTAFKARSRALRQYFKWLYNTHNIDVIDKYYRIKNTAVESADITFFYSVEELYKEINAALTVEIEHDIQGVAVGELLKWYGITEDEYISIMLTDVHDNVIHIPLTNRDVTVDRITADFVNSYKNSEGYGKRKYIHPNLFRTATRKGGEIDITAYRRQKQKFLMTCDNNRFEGQKVYYSGRYMAMLLEEQKRGKEFTFDDADEINRILGLNLKRVAIYNRLREFALFKKGYYAFTDQD